MGPPRALREPQQRSLPFSPTLSIEGTLQIKIKEKKIKIKQINRRKKRAPKNGSRIAPKERSRPPHRQLAPRRKAEERTPDGRGPERRAGIQGRQRAPKSGGRRKERLGQRPREERTDPQCRARGPEQAHKKEMPRSGPEGRAEQDKMKEPAGAGPRRGANPKETQDPPGGVFFGASPRPRGPGGKHYFNGWSAPIFRWRPGDWSV